MEVINYITENAFVLIPALYIIGGIIKGIKKIPDKYIPLILLAVGTAGAMALLGPSVNSAIQGILIAGVTVYGDQIVKQMQRIE